MNNDDKRIREFAYQIWESEGKPEGQEARHWEMAHTLAQAEALAPKKAAASKAKPRITITPVENGRICSGCTPSCCAMAAHVWFAACSPCAPVPAFALPVLMTNARMSDVAAARWVRQTCTGAAQ